MIQHASIDDSTLFERITRHDAEAFGIVMRRYAGALYAFAFRIVGDTLAAEDIVQEVFINLWEKRRKLSPGPSLRNFLYLAVRNLSLNHLRMQKNHLAQTNAYLFEQKAGLWVIEEERYRLLSEAIKQLPPRTATVIGYSCDGLSQEEIARKMGITVATVKLLKSQIEKDPRAFIFFTCDDEVVFWGKARKSPASPIRSLRSDTKQEGSNAARYGLRR